jgi:uncharacterized protein (DUF302 family)
VDIPFDETLAITRAALPAEGFGVITEIDVRKTMKEKLNIDGKRYMILGACNPQLAHRALSAEPQMGLLLPCNVVVYEEAEDRTVVEAIDPLTMLDLAGDHPDIRDVAADARKRLVRVIDAVAMSCASV